MTTTPLPAPSIDTLNAALRAGKPVSFHVEVHKPVVYKMAGEARIVPEVCFTLTGHPLEVDEPFWAGYHKHRIVLVPKYKSGWHTEHVVYTEAPQSVEDIVQNLYEYLAEGIGPTPDLPAYRYREFVAADLRYPEARNAEYAQELRAGSDL